MKILHSSRSDEWYTPLHIIELSRDVLGTIDLDPASCEFANKTVRAKKYFDIVSNGLESSWGSVPTNIFINPPSGKSKDSNISLMKRFWEKLLDHKQSGLLEQAIFIGFSLEQLQTTQSCVQSIGEFPICIPAKRVRFVSPAGNFNSPTHGQVIAYVPGLQNNTSKFYNVFSELGVVMSPR